MKLSEKKTKIKKFETGKISESFFLVASTPVSSNLKNSINSKKSKQLKKPHTQKRSNPIKDQLTKTEKTSLPIPKKKKKEQLKKQKPFLPVAVANFF